MPVSLKHIQGLGQGKCLKEAKPFTRMPVVCTENLNADAMVMKSAEQGV
jgi:hypothetical protein